LNRSGIRIPPEGVFWRAGRPTRFLDPLDGRHQCDVAIVGGGIAGLSAAQWLAENASHLSVAVLEATTCGAGASGRSSGFITPDSELGLRDLVRRFGSDGQRLWTDATESCGLIKENIRRFGVNCGLIEADSVYAATRPSGVRDVQEEHQARMDLGLPSRFYEKDATRRVLGSDAYLAALRYPNTFAIDPFAYLQCLRDVLLARGVRIFERSPVVRVGQDGVQTAIGTAAASHVVVALDRFTPSLGLQQRDVYHAQTGLVMSEPLDSSLIRSLFPDDTLLVWDTELIYSYFRATPDHRLLVGGGLLRKTFSGDEATDLALPRHIIATLERRFPQTRDVQFANWWPGLIGISKDLLPIAGRDRRRPWLSFAVCSAGLPWSTLAGRLAAEEVVNGSSAGTDHFRPNRSFTEFDLAQPLLGKRLTFALSSFYAKNYLKGSASAVRKRTQGIAATVGGVAIGALVRTLRRKHRKRSRHI
jgi:gamma-glutamylputrescine oxidase